MRNLNTYRQKYTLNPHVFLSVYLSLTEEYDIPLIEIKNNYGHRAYSYIICDKSVSRRIYSRDCWFYFDDNDDFTLHLIIMWVDHSKFI